MGGKLPKFEISTLDLPLFCQYFEIYYQNAMYQSKIGGKQNLMKNGCCGSLVKPNPGFFGVMAVLPCQVQDPFPGAPGGD